MKTTEYLDHMSSLIFFFFFFMKIELIKSSGLSLQKNLSLIKSCESGRKNMDLLWFDKSIKSKRLKLKHVNSLYIKCAFFLHGYDYMSPRVSSVIRLFLYPKWKVLFWKAEERCSLSFLHLLFEILKKNPNICAHFLSDKTLRSFWDVFLSFCNEPVYKQRRHICTVDTRVRARLRFSSDLNNFWVLDVIYWHSVSFLLCWCLVL